MSTNLLRSGHIKPGIKPSIRLFLSCWANLFIPSPHTNSVAENWLYNNRYLLGIGALIAVFSILALPIIGYVQGYWSSTVSQLIITGLGALGTVTLAILTVVTLTQNRQIMEERRKDREAPIQQAVLQEIVLSAEERMEKNYEKLFEEQFDWMEATTQEIELLAIDLETLQRQDDPVAREEFEEKYPEVDELMAAYDGQIFYLNNTARKIIEEIQSPLKDYIRSNQIMDSEGYEIEVGRVINRLLNMEEILSDDAPPDWWRENEQAFKDIARENSEEYSEFLSEQNELTNLEQEVSKALIEVKKDIRQEYGIYPDN